jgi:hypothetical protein
MVDQIATCGPIAVLLFVAGLFAAGMFAAGVFAAGRAVVATSCTARTLSS